MTTKIHTFTVPEPGEPKLEIAELTVTQVLRIADNAARDDGLNILAGAQKQASAKRLLAIRAYGDLRVDSNGTGPQDILGVMSVRALGFLDVAIDHVHDVRAEETAPFFATMKTKEV